MIGSEITGEAHGKAMEVFLSFFLEDEIFFCEGQRMVRTQPMWSLPERQKAGFHRFTSAIENGQPLIADYLHKLFFELCFLVQL